MACILETKTIMRVWTTVTQSESECKQIKRKTYTITTSTTTQYCCIKDVKKIRKTKQKHNNGNLFIYKHRTHTHIFNKCCQHFGEENK